MKSFYPDDKLFYVMYMPLLVLAIGGLISPIMCSVLDKGEPGDWIPEKIQECKTRCAPDGYSYTPRGGMWGTCTCIGGTK